MLMLRKSSMCRTAPLRHAREGKAQREDHPLGCRAEGSAQWFPPLEQALDEPAGLLAAGDLSPSRLLAAYRQGIFPWYSPGQPVLWWSPDPRPVLFPKEFNCALKSCPHIADQRLRMRGGSKLPGCNRSLRRPQAAQREPGSSRKCVWPIPICIDADFAQYGTISRWKARRRPMYGVRLDSVFFGESMFRARARCIESGAGPLVKLVPVSGIELIDCQVASRHLQTLGRPNLE